MLYDTLTDVTVSSGRGSICLFVPNSDIALAWVDQHVQLEGWQWLGRGFGVEHRCAGPLIDGMLADGLRVEVLS